ncbi:hypothetical protein [Acinetobacter nosocomialis]|uniref:hypothetical protein n=1 Tax=Acinetobacter nosocomialis TaxID=106654 RepID=UPI0005A85F0C|nr:hypothetical protein [Acinetobacter nosocomialis]MDO7436861.1 hypothetical protein [Acinetobacter nosocomialis]
MVRKVLSKYGETPPTDDMQSRKILTNGPINPVEEVLSLLQKTLPTTMTRKSISDLQRLGFDAEDLRELIHLAVTTGFYRDSEWCNSKLDGPWFACDSYEVKRKEYVETANKEFEIQYFIKFCINKAGNLICTFSCHLSN